MFLVVLTIMGLAPGTRPGPYEILALLGASGMGEVYRARDTRLDRTVAIKVLSSHLSGRSQLRQRFEREARPFDIVTRRVTGDPVSLVENLSDMQGSGMAEFSLACGTLAYHAGAPLTRLVQLSHSGETAEPGEPAPFAEIRRSPDGRRLAASLEAPRTGSHDLWIYDAATWAGSRPTSFPSDERSPVWSPDGQWIYYPPDAHGHPDIYARRADGSGQQKQILSSDWALSPVDISPDGRMLFYEEFRRERGGTDLGVMSLADSSVRSFLQTLFGEHSARISPDGQWVAFVSDETGKQEIYVAPIGSGETRRRVSISGGNAPR